MSAALARSQDTASKKALVAGDYPFTQRDFREIADMLYEDARIELNESKATLVYSRLVKRLRALNLESFRDYCEMLGKAGGVEERRNMLSALTTNVTRFFREGHHFNHLETVALPPLLEKARRGERIRIWSAACSSGEEPYSIAMTLLGVEAEAAALDIKILATDIDPNVIARGRAGVYPSESLDDIPPATRQKFFRPAADNPTQFAVSDAMRKLVAFRPLNLNAHWPMRGDFQAIFCRNVVIYFDHATQHGLWGKFAEKLVPEGFLYIGHSERVAGPAAECFENVGITAYRRNRKAAP
jgi:chemotaxis protein methyltransferase CheR